jgi:hypothetical protein
MRHIESHSDRKAAENHLTPLTVRIGAFLVAAILVPLIVWNFRTLSDTQTALSAMNQRVIVLEDYDARREQATDRVTERRDDQINEIVQRLARVETQITAMLATLNRLADRLDRRRSGGERPTRHAGTQS